jgi:hypothetical protein
MEKDIASLQHTTWRCQYHVVFAPKYRRMVIYGQIRADIGQILRKLCEQKGVEIISYALSGLISGLGGAYMSMGYLSWFARDMMGGRGFMAMAAMNIAGGEPLETALNALLFAGAQALSIFAQKYHINADLILAFPYIFAVVLITVLTLMKSQKEKKRKQQQCLSTSLYPSFPTPTARSA